MDVWYRCPHEMDPPDRQSRRAVGSPTVEVIGRQAELLAIGAWLGVGGANRSRSAWPAALLLEGEPGIGKTTISEEAIRLAEAEGAQVLACRPRPSDAALSHVALTDLLRAVPAGTLRALPSPQRRAIEVATLRREARGVELDPRAVGNALTSLLAELGDSGPLLVAVDDAQWLDPPSADALAFALHRLDGHDVRLLMAVRVETPRRASVPVLASLEVRAWPAARAAPRHRSAERRGNSRGVRAGARQVGHPSAARPHPPGVGGESLLRTGDRPRDPVHGRGVGGAATPGPGRPSRACPAARSQAAPRNPGRAGPAGAQLAAVAPRPRPRRARAR